MAPINKIANSKRSQKSATLPIYQTGTRGQMVMHRLPNIFGVVRQQRYQKYLLEEQEAERLQQERKSRMEHNEALFAMNQQFLAEWAMQEVEEVQDDPDIELLFLNREGKQKRLDWALAHRDWEFDDWRNVFNLEEIEPLDGEDPFREVRPDTLSGPEGCGKDISLLKLITSITAPKIVGLGNPQTLEEFRSILSDLWQYDLEMVVHLDQLYHSMPYRVASVIESGGEPLDREIFSYIHHYDRR